MQQIYNLGIKRKLVPSNSSVARLRSFYNCVATLMTSQLQSLALESIQDYTHLIAQDPVRSAPLIVACYYLLHPHKSLRLKVTCFFPIEAFCENL